MRPTFTTLRAAAHAFRRCRNGQDFKLTGARDLKRPCKCCGKPLGEFPDDVCEGYRSNICTYYPKHKAFALRHYLCAWGDIMTTVSQLARLRS